MSKILNNLKRIIHPKYLKNKLLKITLKGNNVLCPCCGSSFITFLPAGIKKRSNAKCIHCGSLERHRTLWLYLHEHSNIFNSKINMLHIAPEKLLYLKFKTLNNINYHPIDLNPDKYDYGFKTIKMDATEMSYDDSTFDVIICNHVLEHIPDDKKAMKEMHRVLKPEGWAILNVPINANAEQTIEDPLILDPEKRLELFGQPDHVRIYGRDYMDRLMEAGFKVKVIDYVSQFNQDQQFQYGLNPNEYIYFCTK